MIAYRERVSMSRRICYHPRVTRYIHTEGICLSSRDWSDTSQIVCMLTPDRGRVSLIVKGATRAPRLGVRRGIDLLGRYDFVYTTRRAGSLQNLTERSLLEGFRGMHAGLEPLLCGYYAAELAMHFTIEADPSPGFYGHVLGALRAFDAGEPLGLGVLRLEMAVLHEHGTAPWLDDCARCNAALPQTGKLHLSPADGGVLCPDCVSAGSPRHAMPIRASLLPELRGLARNPVAAVITGPRRILAMSRALRFLMRDHLRRELRMWRYLHGRRLSRSLYRIRKRVRR
jgi:DNA repair protein RecO (recombination protein O)